MVTFLVAPNRERVFITDQPEGASSSDIISAHHMNAQKMSPRPGTLSRLWSKRDLPTDQAEATIVRMAHAGQQYTEVRIWFVRK
jgi:hypothetical protein